MDKIEILQDMFTGMPRGGPGSNASTRRAYGLLTDVPAAPRILDVGCGPGMQTLELARLSGGEVTGLDNHQPFLDALAAGAKAAGLQERVRTVNGSMDVLPFGPEEFDIVWAEGSLFVMGFDRALSYLKGFIKPGGYLAATELTWLRPDPPEEPRRYLTKVYPAITDAAGNLALFAAAGYGMVEHFPLPFSDWWDDFYSPMEKRLPLLRDRYRGNPEGLAAVEEIQEEIEMHRKYGDYYGYYFYVAKVGRR